MAEADEAGEFVPRSSREELRLLSFFTLLGGVQHAVPTDRYTFYPRTAQDWFLLAVGSFGALLLAIAHVVCSS
jgi:hypothetical protein